MLCGCEACETKFSCNPLACCAVYALLAHQLLSADAYGEWQQDPAMATHLLAAADIYQLPRLARICEQRLCRSISVDNAAHLLVLAEQHHAHVSHVLAGGGGGGIAKPR
jgi:hypothetical protein